MFPNLNELENYGVEVRRFCGVPVAEIGNDYIACDKEAIGELTAQLEDGTTVPVPVCAGHLEEISKNFPVERLDNGTEVVVL